MGGRSDGTGCAKTFGFNKAQKSGERSSSLQPVTRFVIRPLQHHLLLVVQLADEAALQAPEG